MSLSLPMLGRALSPVLSPRHALALACAAPIAFGLSACAKTVSTSGLNGEAKSAAETIKDLQSDVTAGDQKKICQNDLAKALVAKLGATGGGCEKAIKGQLTEVDSFEVTVEAMQVSGGAATAHVKSIYSGKSRKGTLSLVKEGGKWKISSLG
ncbi:MAG: nuclear transport factor 2 family protein [Solirubrobacterales bacterium]